MFKWFRRASKRIEVPKLRSRSEDAATTKVDLDEFTPPSLEFLGRAAYVQLTLFENLSRIVSTAPTTGAKTALSRNAELSIAKHRALAEEITRAGADPAATMEPYTAEIDQFERVTRGADWFENLLTCYITTGFLDDFFALLAPGLPGGVAKRVAEIYGSDSGEALLVQQLEAAITDNSRLASRLAMWGRRLVGDTLLVARSALVYSANLESAEERIEPAFTELIAAHTRRMDALGLTA
ncbi:MAG: hypothetical protein EPN91_07820 [Salinibacterium sp.]|nr:MAG: hypothetical protein EPN91_07820 [Salinibacterium sp.]